MENLYQGNNSKTLDPRGMFIVQGREEIKIWVGSLIPPVNMEPYKECVENFIKII
jgi:shikimate 5-dehydrogenase